MSLRITNQRIWVIIGIISLSWGTTPIAGRIGLAEGIGPSTVAAGGSLVAAVAVWLMIGLMRRRNLVGPAELRIGLVLAFLAVLLPQQARYVALANASAGFVTLVNALIPLGTALVAHFMLADEPLKPGTTFGLLLGLAGTAALILIGDSGIIGGGDPRTAGVMALAAVVFISFAGVYAKRYAGQYSVLGVTGVQLAMGSIAQWVVALTIDGLPLGHSTTGLLAILYIGTIGMFLPLSLYYFLIRHVPVVFSSVISYLIPLVAVIAGVLLLDEQVQPGILLGGALVLSGVVVTDLVRIRGVRRQGA
ncbi:MAG: DMT family transporter [Acidimicrobiia bacterium]|nr:DMT family transporter [Acidimicrobiia bacterium]MYF84454.1 DMT family transporter [Acidimicrobiia bacterium]